MSMPLFTFSILLSARQRVAGPPNRLKLDPAVKLTTRPVWAMRAGLSLGLPVLLRTVVSRDRKLEAAQWPNELK